jgi:PAS domain S-box-containing protein
MNDDDLALETEPPSQARPAAAPTPEDVLKLVHELRVNEYEVAHQREQLERVEHDLATARERIFELYELAPVAYLTVDAGAAVIAANLTASTLLGVDRKRLVGCDLRSRLPQVEVERFMRFLEELCQSPARRSIELELINPARGALSARVDALSVRGGAECRIELALTDLGNRREAELNLREYQSRWRAILDTVADGVLTVGAGGQVTACNAAAARLFGVEAEKLMGRPITLFVPSFPQQPFSGKREFLGRRSDGTRFALEVAVNSMRGDPMHPQLVVVLGDITDRKNKDNDLRQALSRFREIAEQIQDVFYVVDARSGQSLYASPAFDRVFGRPQALHTAIPWPALEWVHADDQEAVAEAAEGLLRGLPFDLTYRVLWPDRSVHFVHSNAFLVPGQARITGIARDVTDEVLLQDELRQAQRMESIGTLASGVAHDFNNLLMGVGGCIQLALKKVDARHPAEPHMRRAAESILRGAALTRQILRFSDKRARTEGPVELDVIVASAHELVRRLLGEHISVRVVTEAAGVQVLADAGEIEQVLMNLASNARDAMPGGGTLTLTTFVDGDCASLSVRDSGAGMSPEVRARVFEPFFTTKDVGKGTGLGLSTVFGVARRLNGSVVVDSSEGYGTTVTLKLPIFHGKLQLVSDSQPPPSRGRTILIVDDDAMVRATVENFLETLGYRTLSVESVAEALMLLEMPTEPIHLAIVDVMMPSALGTKLQKHLTAEGKTLPVIFMSGHPQDELLRTVGLEPSARLLAKPFEAMQLGAAIAEAFGEAALTERRARVLVVDDNRDVGDVFQQLLELQHHEAVVAYDGEEAVRLASEFVPDVVLCDIELGEGMTGYDVARALRRDSRLQSTRLIAVTGLQSASSTADAVEAGFEQVLTKPLEVDVVSELLLARQS